jgi:hypothetical protein
LLAPLRLGVPPIDGGLCRSGTGGLAPCLAMDENRCFGMRKHLDGLTAEHERRDAVATVRGHDGIRSQPFDPAVSMIAR